MSGVADTMAVWKRNVPIMLRSLLPFFPQGLRHLHSKRREKSDNVAVVRRSSPTEAPSHFMLLRARLRSLCASPAFHVSDPRWITVLIVKALK
jgi:hypothetical protein